jgi:hypothetical protein
MMDTFEKFKSKKLLTMDKVLGGIQSCACNSGSGGFSTSGGPGEIDYVLILQVCGSGGAECTYSATAPAKN